MDNRVNLERLASCIASQTCGPNEKKIVLLASGHFGEPSICLLERASQVTTDLDNKAPHFMVILAVKTYGESAV